MTAAAASKAEAAAAVRATKEAVKAGAKDGGGGKGANKADAAAAAAAAAAGELSTARNHIQQLESDLRRGRHHSFPFMKCDKVPEALRFRARVQQDQFKILETKDAISRHLIDMASSDSSTLNCVFLASARKF